MKSIYAACLSRLGLSHADAALLHGVGVSTIRHWSAGTRRPPGGVWLDLQAYSRKVCDRADAIAPAAYTLSQALACDVSDGDPITLMAVAHHILEDGGEL